jgi:UDP-2,3-diacylglucosamine hydrolase
MECFFFITSGTTENRYETIETMRIGLIAGNGQFPLIFSRKAQEKGFTVYAVAYKNEADPAIENSVHAIEWIHLGQVKRLISFFKKNNISEAVMAGGITKTRIFSDVKPDLKAFSIIAGMLHTHDDAVLRAFANALEKEGIRIKASTFLVPELLAPEGCWTKRKPNRSEKADIQLGWNIASEIGRLDIGQCVVTGGGSVLAVEAIDGSDSTIKRGGNLSKGTAVAVKMCKPNQDQRFDMPAAGSQTIRFMNESGVKALALEAGKVIVFDRKEMIALADKFGISIVAIKS